MNKKTTFIFGIALTLSASKKKTIPAYHLANLLNAAGFCTQNGTNYQGNRGTYTLIGATYNRVKSSLGQTQADLIATSFTKPNGAFAWDK